jgi:uncharacterized membrane protein
MKKFAKIIAGSLWVLPVLASAQGFGYFQTLTDSGKTLLNSLVTFLVSLAVVWFIWNVIQYSIAADEDKKSAAKSQMINGIIAIAVIVSIWGLVAILQNMFGATDNAAKTIKLLPTVS